MRVTTVWLPGGEVHLETRCDATDSPNLRTLAYTAAVCTSAEPACQPSGSAIGDPTELRAARAGPHRRGAPRSARSRHWSTGGVPLRPPTCATCPRSILKAAEPLPCRPRAQPKPCCRVARTSPRPAAATTTSPSFSQDLPGRVVDQYAAQGLRKLAIVRRRLDDDTVIGPPPSIPRMGCACSGWSRCSTRPAPRSSTRSPRHTAPGLASTWSPGTAG